MSVLRVPSSLREVVEDLPHFDRRLDGRGVTAMDSKAGGGVLRVQG